MVVATAFGWLSLVGAARALTPESPEVKKVVAKAVKYLETPHPPGTWDNQPGAKAIVALALAKHYGQQGPKHPQVVAAVNTIRAAIKDGSINQLASPVYDLGVMLIFFFDLDPAQYRTEMEQLLNLLVAAQKPHGGFGYTGKATGDTSMTQYGVLGLWACESGGIPTPVLSWEGVANWLLRTQDPRGGYGYQGKDPGSMNLVAQDEIRLSLSSAGLGSLCICADHLRLFPPPEEHDPKLPSALKKVTKQQSLTKNVSPALVTEALNRGKGWFAGNYRIDPPEWAQYYLYALERYKSFLAEVQHTPADNQWYDEGYRFLAKTQHDDGHWTSLPTAVGHDLPDTAFGVLFLLRSTKRSIEHAKSYGGGLLVGGRGLPENASEVEIRGGSVRPKPLKGPAMELLQKMADPDDPQFAQALEGLEQQSLVDEGDLLTDVQKRLRAMAAGKSPEAKAAGLQLLGRTRELDNAPLLIEALKDPNPLVASAADDALRFLARKFRGAGILGGSEEDARKQVRERWKAWYREIRPDAQFDDD